jgi:hypothetical protein
MDKEIEICRNCKNPLTICDCVHLTSKPSGALDIPPPAYVIQPIPADERCPVCQKFNCFCGTGHPKYDPRAATISKEELIKQQETEFGKEQGETKRQLQEDAQLVKQQIQVERKVIFSEKRPTAFVVINSKPTVPEILEGMAKTFKERNLVYKDNYKHFGKVLSGMFPEGLHIEKGDEAAFNRFALMFQVIGKMSRYASNVTTGGHKDSAHDAAVYSAMLEESTDEPNKKD